MWNSQSVHVWELKNQTYQLDGTSSFSHCACAQIAVYMKADIESMWARHSYIPAISTGLLTNGSYWILVTAYSTLVLGNSINIHWTHTNPIHYSCKDKRDVDKEHQIINLIFLSCKQSLLNLEELKQNSVLSQLSKIKLDSPNDGASDGKKGPNSGDGSGRRGNSRRRGGRGKGPNSNGNGKGPSSGSGGLGNGYGSGNGKGPESSIDHCGRDLQKENQYFGKRDGGSSKYEAVGRGFTKQSSSLSFQNVQKIKTTRRFDSEDAQDINALKAFPVLQRLALLQLQENVMTFTAEELFEL
jgi:hypothetical protein